MSQLEDESADVFSLCVSTSVEEVFKTEYDWVNMKEIVAKMEIYDTSVNKWFVMSSLVLSVVLIFTRFECSFRLPCRILDDVIPSISFAQSVRSSHLRQSRLKV